MALTFEERAVALWDALGTSTNAHNLTMAQVQELWEHYVTDYDDLLVEFGHPPRKPRVK